MSLVALVLHDKLEDIPHIKECVKTGVSVSTYSGITSKSQVDAFFSSKITKDGMTIGLMYHNDMDGTLPLFPGLQMNNMDSVVFNHFMTKCKQRKVSNVDLITCDVINARETNEILRVSLKYGVTIRFSVDKSSTNTNWIMESHNVNIEPNYFEKPLDPSVSLGMSNFSYTYVLSSNGKLTTSGMGQNLYAIEGLPGPTITDYIYWDGGNAYDNIFVKSDNTLLLWGASSDGNLAAAGTSYVPTTDSTHTFLTVSLSLDATMAKVNDGGVIKAVACGRNYFNANGVGSTSTNLNSWSYCIDSNGAHMTDVAQVARAWGTSYILKTDGTVWGAGLGDYNELTGHGNTIRRDKFHQIKRLTDGTYSNLTNVVKLSVNTQSSYCVCAILSTGEVLMWGRGSTGTQDAIDTVGIECGTRILSIPGETIVDVYPYQEYQYHHLAYVKTASNKYYTVNYTNTPVEDTDIAPGSSTIGGAGKYVVKIVRTKEGFIGLLNDGKIIHRGRFVYAEFPLSNDKDSSWTLSTTHSNIADIGGNGEYQWRSMSTDGLYRTHGYATQYQLGYDSSLFYELEWFSGINIVKWADAGYFVAIIDDNNNVHVRMYNTSRGPYNINDEAQLTTGGDVQQITTNGTCIAILKTDGTVWLFGDIPSSFGGFNRYSYELQQWGHSYKDTTQFVMVAMGGQYAIHALDANGNVYSSGSNQTYWFGPSHTGASSLSTTALTLEYDNYKDLIFHPLTGNVYTDWNRKIVSIYAVHTALILLFEGGYVSGVGQVDMIGNNGNTGPYMRVVWNNDINEPLKDVISITGVFFGSNKAVIYGTSNGDTYYAGRSLEYSFNGAGNDSIRARKMADMNGVSLHNSRFMSFTTQGKGFIWKAANGNTYVLGQSIYTGVGSSGSSNTPILLSDRIGNSFTIKDAFREFVLSSTNLTTNVSNLVNNYSGEGFKTKIKELVLTQGEIFSTKFVRLSYSQVSDLFSGSFATELNESPRSILIKIKENSKYVLSSSDITNMNNGDVLYIADTGTTNGTSITLNINSVDYTYTLYTDKITYNSTDYVIGDVVAFGDLNLQVKGLTSTEFIVEGTSGGPGAPPCFDGRTLILTPSGYRKMKDLKDGDEIVLHNRVETIKVNKNIYQRTTKKTAPYMIEKGAFAKNVPFEDTIVSPSHAIFCGNGKFTFPKTLVSHTNKVYRLPEGKLQIYYNIETPNYMNSLMNVNGLMAETFTGEQIPKTHQLLYVNMGDIFYQRVVVEKSRLRK